jgi:hypothetical protein
MRIAPGLRRLSKRGTTRYFQFSGLSGLIHQRRVQLALSIRVTIAALVALALAQFLQLPLPLWAVLTAVIVTQMSVGRSLKTTFDYLVGTLGGAIYGGAIGLLIPHSNEIALLAVLAIAVAPLALLAAINPRFSVAPITAIIVLLVPMMTHATQIASALDRVLEVALGGVVGLAISFLFMPSSAHPLLVATAARTLDQMARAFSELLAGLTEGLDPDSLHRIHDGIGQDLVQLNVVGAEAEDERLARLAVGPDTGPLLRTLLRLHHDLVMLGRAAIIPLPEEFATRLESPLAHANVALADYLRASAAALLARRGPPSLNSVESALNQYAVRSLRSVATVSRELFQAMRRNAFSQSGLRLSRCTTMSRISNAVWLNGLGCPRKWGAAPVSLIDSDFYSRLQSRVDAASDWLNRDDSTERWVIQLDETMQGPPLAALLLAFKNFDNLTSSRQMTASALAEIFLARNQVGVTTEQRAPARAFRAGYDRRMRCDKCRGRQTVESLPRPWPKRFGSPPSAERRKWPFALGP